MASMTRTTASPTASPTAASGPSSPTRWALRSSGSTACAATAHPHSHRPEKTTCHRSITWSHAGQRSNQPSAPSWKTSRTQTLSTVIEYSLRDGTPMHATIWQLLTIVVTHSMQHRAEAAEALTKIKRSPGNLDFIVFMREA
jgi:uncharacterized damage-inducible protein DinB